MPIPPILGKPRPGDLQFPVAAPEPGSVTQVLPGVVWLRMPLPFALDHINLWLLADEAGWTLVDCGYATKRARALWAQVLERDLGGRALTRIIVTHCHPDHVGLAGWLAERSSLVPWMTQSEFLLARAIYNRNGGTSLEDLRALFARHGLEPARFAAATPPDDHYRRGVPQLPPAIQPLNAGDTAVIGGKRWRVIVGRGHSPEHAALYCEELQVLISGDMVLPRISTNVSVWATDPEGDPLAQYLASLDRFSQLPPATLVLPSHGLPFRPLARRIEDLRAHHRGRLERALEVCREEHTAAELLPKLFGRDFRDYQLLFAMGETIAHLNHLMHAGRVRRSAGPDGIYRFESAAPPGGEGAR